jgi:presenilin-like A22 family membrane protease
MVASAMAEPGVRIEHPNRKKATSKATRVAVFLLLLVSAGLMVIISVGGWDAIEGAKALQVAYIVLYVVLAFFVLRWSRGVLPLAAALAIVLLIFAAVSAPAWLDRDREGFTSPALDESILGLLCFILIPLQVLLIAFAMRAFRQEWHVEVEHAADEGARGDASPAPA